MKSRRGERHARGDAEAEEAGSQTKAQLKSSECPTCSIGLNIVSGTNVDLHKQRTEP